MNRALVRDIQYSHVITAGIGAIYDGRYVCLPAVTYCSSSWKPSKVVGETWIPWHAMPLVQFSSSIQRMSLGKLCLGTYGCFLHHQPYFFRNMCGTHEASNIRREDGFWLRMTFISKVSHGTP
jgi:hypothetical protein